MVAPTPHPRSRIAALSAPFLIHQESNELGRWLPINLPGDNRGCSSMMVSTSNAKRSVAARLNKCVFWTVPSGISMRRLNLNTVVPHFRSEVPVHVKPVKLPGFGGTQNAVEA
jgi:hypothetical protein